MPGTTQRNVYAVAPLGMNLARMAESIPPESARAALPSLQASCVALSSASNSVFASFTGSRSCGRGYSRGGTSAAKRRPLPAMVRYVRKALMQYSRSTIPLTPRYSPRTAASALETCVEETPRV